jgi:hypothetical protein
VREGGERGGSEEDVESKILGDCDG